MRYLAVETSNFRRQATAGPSDAIERPLREVKNAIDDLRANLKSSQLVAHLRAAASPD